MLTADEPAKDERQRYLFQVLSVLALVLVGLYLLAQ